MPSLHVILLSKITPRYFTWLAKGIFRSFNVRGTSEYLSLTQNQLSLSLSLILRPTVTRPVSLGIWHSSGAYDQIFISVGQLLVCWCGALSLARGWICHLRLLLALASAFILSSEYCATREHILLYQERNLNFFRLLRIAGLRWRYSNPPPYGITQNQPVFLLITNLGSNIIEKTPPTALLLLRVYSLPSNG
jgi:hypothetical protein